MIEGPLPRRALPTQDRMELLGEASELLALIRYGHQAFTDRVDEFAGGFPGGGHGGGSRGGGVSRPTERAVVGNDNGEWTSVGDVAQKVLTDYSRALVKVDRAVRELWDIHAEHSMERRGAVRLSDPGCWSCARVEGRFSETYSTPEIEVTERLGRRQVTHKRKLPLCEWCYRFTRPRGHNRLPTFDEVQAHLDGRMVRVRVAPADKEARRLRSALAEAQVADA